MVADPKDPNGYKRKFEREKQLLSQKDEESGQWRIPREKDRKDLRLYASTVLDRVDYSSAFNYLGRLRRLTEVLDKPLRECDIDDINLGMSTLAERNLGKGKSYSQGTRRQYLRTVEDFGSERDIKTLSEIEVPSVSQAKVNEETVLSEREVFNLIEAAEKLRTKALIAVCWECAWRATALLSLKVKHYEDVNDEYGLLKVPTEVTGTKGAGGNKKPVTISKGYLEKWLYNHPNKTKTGSPNPDSALFCRADKKKYYGEHMSGEAIRKQLNRTAENAGIDKERVYVHSFRHARTTYMKKSSRYSDMDIEHTLDWSQGSNQMKRYSHVNQDEKVASILNAHDIKANEGDINPETQDCPRCTQTIPWDANSCPYCSLRLSSGAPQWYQIYRKSLVSPEDDLVLSQYDDGLPPQSMSQLSKGAFKRVLAVIVDTGIAVYDGRSIEDAYSEHGQMSQIYFKIGEPADVDLDEISTENLTKEDGHWVVDNVLEGDVVRKHLHNYEVEWRYDSNVPGFDS